jgi:hypothetical protein
VSTYPAISAGQRITASLLTSMLPITVRKPADQSVTSSTTLTNDNDLVVSLEANATYEVDGYLMVFGSGAGLGDCKIDFTIPSGASMRYTSGGVVNSNPATAYEDTVNANTTARAIGTNGSVDMGVPLRADIVMGSTAGSVQLRFAQNSSNATATGFRAGSRLRFRRIA